MRRALCMCRQVVWGTWGEDVGLWGPCLLVHGGPFKLVRGVVQGAWGRQSSRSALAKAPTTAHQGAEDQRQRQHAAPEEHSAMLLSLPSPACGARIRAAG